MDSVNAFANTGPTHMIAKTGAAGSSDPSKTIETNWDNEEHRRCITACLVNGTYVLESERTKSSEADDDDSTCDEPLAPAWWESFHFRLFRKLKCQCECVGCKICRQTHILAGRSPRFIYGAIFEYAPPDGSPRHPSAPSYIVAFRGTMQRDATTLGDMWLNLKIVFNAHHNCVRFSHAREEVGKFLDSISGSSAVWLAGYSLGASIALNVGRAIMASRELNLPTFLFNPPQVSLSPPAMISAISDKLPMGEVIKNGLHTGSNILKYALGKILKTHKENMDEQFEQLSPWVPNLYVHQRDIISKGFIDYFEQREWMRKWLPLVAASSTKLSYGDMCRFVLGGQNDRPHLLPSAILWTNQSPDGDAHELRQWWQPGPELLLIQKSYKWSASTNIA